MKERRWELHHGKLQETWQWIELVGESVFWPHAPNWPKEMRETCLKCCLCLSCSVVVISSHFDDFKSLSFSSFFSIFFQFFLTFFCWLASFLLNVHGQADGFYFCFSLFFYLIFTLCPSKET